MQGLTRTDTLKLRARVRDISVTHSAAERAKRVPWSAAL